MFPSIPVPLPSWAEWIPWPFWLEIDTRSFTAPPCPIQSMLLTPPPRVSRTFPGYCLSFFIRIAAACCRHTSRVSSTFVKKCRGPLATQGGGHFPQGAIWPLFKASLTPLRQWVSASATSQPRRSPSNPAPSTRLYLYPPQLLPPRVSFPSERDGPRTPFTRASRPPPCLLPHRFPANPKDWFPLPGWEAPEVSDTLRSNTSFVQPHASVAAESWLLGKRFAVGEPFWSK